MSTPMEQAQQLRKQWNAELQFTDLQSVPRVLWHYTDAGGMKGIVESERLWATNTKFLNDHTELNYGLEIGYDEIRTYAASLDEAGDERTAFFFNGLIDPERANLPGFLRDRLEVYVACFCANGDLLSQWRAYAGRETAGGYALGFEAGLAPAWIDLAGSHGLRLRRVEYRPDEQRAWIRGLIYKLAELLREDPADTRRWDAVAAQLLNGLVEFASFCKDPAFAEEQEWRIIYERANDQGPLPVLFRPARGLIVPYVELELPNWTGATAGHLPLRTVLCGPGPEPALKQAGARSLLSAHDRFSDVEVQVSPAPLRL